MKLDDLNTTQDSFSYIGSEYHKFSNSKFIVAVKDEEFPDRNLIPLFYYDEGKVFGIDTYAMSKIHTSIPRNLDSETYGFSLLEVVKISQGDIKADDNWFDGSNKPKCWTFRTNINPIENNEVLEVFNGEIDESKGRVKINEDALHSLITELYIEKSTAFFVETESKLIGPFKALRKDTEGYFIVEKHNWKIFGEYENKENSYYSTTVNDIQRKLIVPSTNTLNLISEKNFLSDKEILEEFKEKLNKADFDINEINSVLNHIKEATEVNSIKEYVENNDRIKSILEKTETTLASDYKLLEFLPQVGQIKKDIEVLTTNKFNLEEDKRKLQDTIEQIGIDIEESKDSLEKLEEQIDNKVRTKDEALKNVNSELEEEINKLKEQKNTLENEVKSFEATKKLEDIEAEIRVREKDLKDKENQKSTLNESIDSLRKDNLEVQEDSQKTLIKLVREKKYFDFLSGRDLVDYDQQEKPSYQPKTYCDNPNHNDYLSFRTLVLDKLTKLGRKYDTHFVDNLLISIHQNTLTVFAGLPGTGKTSLSRMLIKILTPSERSTEVSVHRGWTSQKDLIGFQNPLNNKFHPSSTGMYELLSQINTETQHGDFKDLPLAYVLLDEANLSPLEHYWSTFYNSTDSIARENSLLKLNLGDSTQIFYPNNIRFIATINSDQTTEPLSPRILDRVNMIQIPQQLQFESNIEFVNEEIEHIKLAYAKSIEYFNLLDFREDKIITTKSEKVDKLMSIYSEIKKKFKDLQIFISPRIDIAVKKYFTIATKVMVEDTRPLDYCIAQRILPLINVQGDKSKEKLEGLQIVFEKYNLSYSTDILNRILQSGEDDSFFEGTYNYFLTFSYAQGL
ncbi:hypothetical protein [Ancylomarina sp.]|uniref:hypothetical protein n=1 Tax=Ancylomarina sp. TaxID=1970196 RepID=UPI003562679B